MAQRHQTRDIRIVQTVGQLPQQNSIKTLGRVVQFVPDLVHGATLANTPAKSDEHITDIQSLYPACEKPDIFLAHRPHVQQFRLGSLLEMFHKKFQRIAGVAHRPGVMLQIRVLPICSESSQRSIPFAAFSGQDYRFFAGLGGRFFFGFSRRGNALQRFTLHLDDGL
jgi:hypothetical protein